MQSRFIKDKDVESRDRKDNRGSGWASGRIFLYAGAVVLLLASALMCNSKYQENRRISSAMRFLRGLFLFFPSRRKALCRKEVRIRRGHIWRSRRFRASEYSRFRSLKRPGQYNQSMRTENICLSANRDQRRAGTLSSKIRSAVACSEAYPCRMKAWR